MAIRPRWKEGSYEGARLRRKHHQDRASREPARRETIDRLVEGMTPANRPLIEDFIAYHRRRRNAVHTILTYVRVISRLEEHANGTAWTEYTPEQVAAWVDARGEDVA